MADEKQKLDLSGLSEGFFGEEEVGEEFYSELDVALDEHKKNTVKGIVSGNAFQSFNALQDADLRDQHAQEFDIQFDIEAHTSKTTNEGTVEESLKESLDMEDELTLRAGEDMLRESVESGVVSGDATAIIEESRELHNVLKGLHAYEIAAIHKGYSPASVHFTDYFFDDTTLGSLNKAQRAQYELMARDAALTAKGLSKEDIKAIDIEMGGIEQPLFSPVDTMADILTGAIFAKTGIKVLGKTLVKGNEQTLIKSIGRDVTYGSLAGGIMTVADAATGSTLASAIAGIVGTPASVALFTMSRKGLATWLANIKSTNPKNYEAIKKVVATDKSSASIKIHSVIEDVEVKPEELLGNPYNLVAESPVVTTSNIASIGGDASAKGKVQEVILSASMEGGSPTQHAARVAIGTGEATGSTIIPHTADPSEISRLEGREDLAVFLRNSFNLADTEAHHLYHSMFEGADQEFINTISARIFDDNSVDVGGLGAYAIDGFHRGKLAPGTKIWNPDIYFDEMADFAVNISSSIDSFSRGMKAHGQKVISQDIYGKLTRSEGKSLDSMLLYSTEESRVLKMAEGGLKDEATGKVFPCSDKLAERYYRAIRFGEYLFNIANASIVRTANKQGVRQLDDKFVGFPLKKTDKKQGLIYGETIDVDGVYWTKELKEEGWVPFKFIDPLARTETPQFKFLNAEEAATRLKEVELHTELLPRRDAFVPIRSVQAKTRYAVTTLTKGEAGEITDVKVIAFAKSSREAKNAVERLQEADPDSFYIAHRKGDEESFVDLTFDKRFVNEVRTMDDDSIERLTKKLIEGGVSEEEVSKIRSYAKTFGYRHRPEFKARGYRRMPSAKSLAEKLTDTEGDVRKAWDLAEDAPLMPSRASMVDYMERTVNFINHQDWNVQLTESYMNKYGKALGVQSWKDAIDPANYKGNKAALATEAKEMRSQLQRIFGTPTTMEVEAQTKLQNLGDWMSTKPMGKEVSDMLDAHFRRGVSIEVSNKLKSIGAHALLGFGNVSQFVVQQTVMLNAFKYAKQPDVLLKAVKDFNSAYLLGMMGEMAGVKAPKESTKLYNLIRRSGANTGMTHEYAEELMTSAGSWSGNFKSSTTKMLEHGMSFMRGGEAVGRGLIWFAERNALIKTIKANKHPRLRIKDIDSDAFLHEVNILTNHTAGNFTKFNTPAAAREGFKSAIFQFWKYPIYQAAHMNPFINKKISKSDAAFILAGWVGAFGSEGIPGFWTMAHLGEELAAKVEDDPTYIGATERSMYKWTEKALEKIGVDAKGEVSDFVKRQLKSGVIAAATDGKWNFANRAGMAHMFYNFTDGLQYSELLGAGLTTVDRAFKGALNSADELLATWTSSKFSEEVSLGIAERATKAVPGISNKVAAFRETVKGDPNPDLLRRFQVFMGISPGSDVEARAKMTTFFRMNKEIKNYTRLEAKRIAEIYSSNPKVARGMTAEVAEFFREINPEYAKSFMDTLFYYSMNQGMTPEQQAERVKLFWLINEGHPK